MSELYYTGTIVKIKGYHGELIVSDIQFNSISITNDCEVWIGFTPDLSNKYIITSWKNNKNYSIVTLRDITEVNQLKNFLEKGIFIEKNKLKLLLTKEYIDEELIGFKVIESSTRKIFGKVIDVLYLPANNVLVIESQDGTLPIPMIDEIITDIDIDKKIIKIVLIDGLLELLNKFNK